MSLAAGRFDSPTAYMATIGKFKPFQIRWRESLGRPDCPYLIRWVLNLGLFSIRVHHWIRSDDKRYFHDHAWWFLTLVLWGDYIDVSKRDGWYAYHDPLCMGQIRFRPAMHRHYVVVPKGGCWTLLLTGPPIRNWGFWVGERFIRPLRYFHKYGHPPCEEQ